MAQQTQSKSSRRSASRRSRSNSGASNGKNAVGAVKEATVKGASTAKDATANRVGTVGSAVTQAAKQVKTPALVAGAGIAGLAGGIAIARERRKKVFGVGLPTRGMARMKSMDLSDAAKNVGAFAERTGQIAGRVRAVSEAISEDRSRRKSPVEVVLEGLTTRSRAAA